MADPTITMSLAPVLGIPTGEKEAGQRVDFKASKFDLLIETKGYLLAWSRACVCPCAPVSDQTEQPDPNCSLCKGQGVFYFGADEAQDLDAYQLDSIQKTIMAGDNAMLIRGLVTSIQNAYRWYTTAGNWQSGTMQVTVRPENRLAYYDRLVVLDSEMPYSQVVDYAGEAVTKLRYPATGVNHVRSESAVYRIGADFSLDDDGQIEWITGKAPTATAAAPVRLAAHYLCHPSFLVTEHPHVIRTTSEKFKKVAKNPGGDARSLPIQAVVSYDFLPRPALSGESA